MQCNTAGTAFEFYKACASGTVCEGGDCTGKPTFPTPDGQSVDSTEPDATATPTCGNGTLDPGEACDPTTAQGCPSECLNPPGCTVQTLVGDATLCTARCETDFIQQAIDGDGCCPTDATPDTDTDCSLCGNGVQDIGETCDPPATCVTSCPATQDPCTQFTFVGSAETCNAQCVATPVTNLLDGDGCCPTGGTADTDTDCMLCGNGQLDVGETCDPPSTCPTSCPPPNGCMQSIEVGSPLTCNAECVGTLIVTPKDGDSCCPNGATAQTDSDCQAAACGDGIIGGSEECDGPDLTPLDCTAFGYFGGGKLSCNTNCTVNTLGCKGSHMLLYSPIVNILAKGDLTKVRWHPSGDYALILGAAGQILRYDPTTQTLSQALTVDGTVADIEVHPAGTFFLVAGWDSDDTGQLWQITDGATLSVSNTTTVTLGKPVALAVSPDGSNWAVGARHTNNISYFLRWSAVNGITKTKGFNASAGLTDIAWTNPAIYGGADTIISSHGVNGADSKSYLLTTDTVTDNGWKGSFGNAGGMDWRPGGTYAMVTGWSSNKIYVFDGSWSMASLPVPTGASPQSVRWKRDGTRALVVGKVIGSPAYAVVIEHRPGAESFDSNAFQDASIPGFTSPPWSKKQGMVLRDSDWQPNNPCDGGLIVGGHSGSSFSPTFGTVIRFYDQDDPDCSP